MGVGRLQVRIGPPGPTPVSPSRRLNPLPWAPTSAACSRCWRRRASRPHPGPAAARSTSHPRRCACGPPGNSRRPAVFAHVQAHQPPCVASSQVRLWTARTRPPPYTHPNLAPSHRWLPPLLPSPPPPPPPHVSPQGPVEIHVDMSQVDPNEVASGEVRDEGERDGGERRGRG